MARVYLRLNREVRQFIGHLLPDEGWEAVIVNDLTEDGTRMSVVRLPDDNFGQQVAIYGDRFYARASSDKFRRDTVWVYRVEDGRNPTRVPVQIEGEFAYLEAGLEPPVIGSAGIVFGSESSPSTPSDTAVNAITWPSRRDPRTRPSQRLAALLASSSVAARTAWRPVAPGQTPDDRGLIEVARTLWTKYRLDRVANAMPRELGILTGRITTGELDDNERQNLKALFDVGVLNGLTADHSFQGATLEGYLLRLAELDPLPAIRAAVWSAMLAGTVEATLRDELCAAAVGLRHTAQTADAPTWSKPVMEALREVARKGDAGVSDLIRSVEGDSEPLAGVAIWAERLSSAVGSPPEPEPAEDGLPSVIESHSPAGPVGFDSARWALAQSVSTQDLLSQRLAAVEALLTDLGQMSTIESPDDVANLTAMLAALAAETTRCLDLLPEPRQAAQDYATALSALSALAAVLPPGSELDSLPLGELDTAAVQDIVTLLSADTTLCRLPPWAWNSITDPSGPREPADKALRAQRLCDPAVRSRLTRLVQVLAGYEDLSAESIALISSPPGGSTPESHLERELDQLRLAAQRLARVPDADRDWVQRALARGDDEEETLDVLKRLHELATHVPTDVAARIREEVIALDDLLAREQRLAQFESAVKFFESAVGSAEEMTWRQLEGGLARSAAGSAPTTAPAFLLTLEYAGMGPTGRGRPPITFVAHDDPGRPYGFVVFPVTLESARRVDLSLNIGVDVKSRWGRHAWAADWDRHSPDAVRISSRDWRKAAEGTFVCSFDLQVAIRRPAKSNDSLDLVVTLTDSISRRPACAPVELDWDSVDTEFTRLTFDWPVGIVPDFVKEHPVGPQKRLGRLVTRFKSGASCAVIAPRRFGKTTLVRYLQEKAREHGLLALEPVSCTSLDMLRNTIDLRAMWTTVATRLQEALDCTIAADSLTEVPAASAFDRARRAAAEREHRGILLLFDEAQLLFPLHGGARLGDRLKDLLESSWMSATDGRVPLVLGFVGLPSLATNMGVNLRNLLEPEEGLEMDESDFYSLIWRATKHRLHTTKEARQRLAQTASNLYLARILTESLGERANRHQRAWATWDDVAAVEADITGQLERGLQGNVAALVRDALNDQPDVNQWQPSPSYPTALALALGRHEGVRGAQPLAAYARQLLNRWCEDQKADQSMPRYRDEDVTRQIDLLVEAGIFVRGEFQSRFVEAWLVGEGRDGLPTSAVNALVKGASTIVNIPDVLEPVGGEGSQAKVFRFSRDGQQWALRRVELTSDDARDQFLEAIKTLKVLMHKVPRGEPGIQYVFDLDAVGFSAQDDMVGVHVYRWVDGHDLQSKVGQLPPAMVADIGLKLSRALHLLHRHRIFHRDIRPRNIVLSHVTKDPVLIDFGFAKLADRSGHTRAHLDYSAPEVTNERPAWTSAADIYALGATCSALLRPDATAPSLASLLDRLRMPSPADRPDAAEAVRQFDQIRSQLLVEHRVDGVIADLSAAAAADADRRWYRDVIDKFEPTLKSIVMGLQGSAFEVAAEVADFLNQVLEAYPVARGAQRLSLGYVKNENTDTGRRFCDRSIEGLHQLRLSLSHGDPKLSAGNVSRKLGNPSPTQLREWLLEGSALIGKNLGVATLGALVQRLLEASPGLASS